MKIKGKIGDVFLVPIDSEKNGYGQIIAKSQDGILYALFFDNLMDTKLPIERSVNGKIFLAGNMTDAKIWHGHWPIVENHQKNLSKVILPHYKVMIDGQFVVTDFAGTGRRIIEEEEADLLMFKSIVAPIIYERALCAHFGLEKWEAEYDCLLYENVLRSTMVAI